MDYPGQELENFDKAIVWRKYVYINIKNFISGKVLEVGAGIGSFTKNYVGIADQLILSEIDPKNYEIIKKKFHDQKITFSNKTTREIKDTFNTIMYLNFLEHIKNDKDEIIYAFEKLEKNGHLIVLVPAHKELYSKFDKAVGHHKRYDIDFFKQLDLKSGKLVRLVYLDAIGYFLYYLNKVFFKEETYPSKFKIFLWDKFFTPITYILDKLLFNKFGKNILYVVKKL